MTKRATFLLVFIFIVLAGCTSGDNTANDNSIVTNNNDTTANNNTLANNNSSVDQVDSPNVPAQCTAQTIKMEDVAQPGDWIKGATEGYSVTLVEYGDFQ